MPFTLSAVLCFPLAFAHGLATTFRPLPDQAWKSALQAFGVGGAKQFVRCVGCYSYTCTVLNDYDVEALNGIGY